MGAKSQFFSQLKKFKRVHEYKKTDTSGGEEMDAKILTSIDGPYIYSKNDSLSIISVKQRKDSSFYIKKNKIKKTKTQHFTSEAGNLDKDSFTFSLMDKYFVPNDIYGPKEKIFVTSDIEGNFNTFYSFLKGNKIIDMDYNWTFGDGHLVIVGDMMDRGIDVLPCLWLLYKLEIEAKKKQGQVHFILGNHEVMNLQLDLRYVKPKYLELAKIVSGIEDDQKVAYNHLMSDHNELVKWMQSKNAIEKIGDNLFLHGGISENMVDAGLSIQEINNYVRKHIRENLYKNPEDDRYANLVLGKMGPLWYRGLIKGYKNDYTKIDNKGLDKILQFYDVEHIVIGHTIIDKEVTSDFNGKVIRVNIKHPKEKFTGKSQALLIEYGTYSKVNDLGEKFELDFTE